MTVFIQKGSDNIPFFSPKPPRATLLLCYFPHKQRVIEVRFSRSLDLGPEKMGQCHHREDLVRQDASGNAQAIRMQSMSLKTTFK